jgi:hypothetical protein
MYDTSKFRRAERRDGPLRRYPSREAVKATQPFVDEGVYLIHAAQTDFSNP